VDKCYNCTNDALYKVAFGTDSPVLGWQPEYSELCGACFSELNDEEEISIFDVQVIQ
jgi:hypothetical protein